MQSDAGSLICHLFNWPRAISKLARDDLDDQAGRRTNKTSPNFSITSSKTKELAKFSFQIPEVCPFLPGKRAGWRFITFVEVRIARYLVWPRGGPWLRFWSDDLGFLRGFGNLSGWWAHMSERWKGSF